MGKNLSILVASILFLGSAKAQTNTPDPLSVTWFNTTQNPIEWNGNLIVNDGNSDTFVVPDGQTWTFNTMTADLGLGSEAVFGINLYSATDQSLIAHSELTDIHPIYAYVNVPVAFSNTVTLNPGTYIISSRWQVTGSDDGTYWSYNTSAQQQAFSVGPVPEPSTYALFSCGSLIFLSFLRRRKA